MLRETLRAEIWITLRPAISELSVKQAEGIRNSIEDIISRECNAAYKKGYEQQKEMG